MSGEATISPTGSRPFAEFFAGQRMPPRLGDVTLRLDSPLLIGEARKPKLHWVRESSFWSLGATATVAALASVTLGASIPWAVGLTLIAVAFFIVAMLMDRYAHRRRAFVLDFERKTLRLDFSTPLTGLPRTWVGPFEQVKGLGLLSLPTGESALTIDIEADQRFREVLVTGLLPNELVAAQTLERLLNNAFGRENVSPPSAETQRTPSVADDLGAGAE